MRQVYPLGMIGW